MSVLEFLACTGSALILGICCGLIYLYKNHHYNRNFVISLALLPVIVQLVIMLVNGNLGAGIAVVGAFNLVRFRSIPGTAKDIVSIFCAMALGLATGMGYITAAFLFLVCFAVMTIVLNAVPIGNPTAGERQLRVTIPEDLDYMGIFDDIFARYTSKCELMRVKTTNMGSLFELTYELRLSAPEKEKEFIDELRTRNGNLRIICGRVPEGKEVM
jgi:hypothetical protein